MSSTSDFRNDFPIFTHFENEHGKKLIYLDSAATSQKPYPVINAVSSFLTSTNANVHRASYTLGAHANEVFERSRQTVAQFVGLTEPERIIFTKNATEAINLVARGFIESECKPGDRIAVTRMEHHANFVPWQQLCKKFGLIFDTISITEDGHLDPDSFENCLKHKPKFVAFTHCSNVLGTVLPVKKLTDEVHASGAKVLIDGSQAIPHMKVDIDDIGADFYVFTGHKMLGPTGVGVLAGKRDALEALPPFLYGGDMIDKVSIDSSSFAKLPNRLEAGTLPMAEVVGLAAACDYINVIGFDWIHNHEQALLKRLIDGLSNIPSLKLYGSKNLQERTGICSFTVRGAHPHDISMVLDVAGICVRSGNHCAQPLFCELGIEGCLRASMYVYNNRDDIDALIAGVEKAARLFSK